MKALISIVGTGLCALALAACATDPPGGPADEETLGAADSPLVDPASAAGCTLGSSSGNVNTCISIIGQGLFVNEMTASADVLEASRTLQVCLHGPDAATSLPRCTAFQAVQPGGTIVVQWFPNRNVPAGTYCARTWRKNTDGSKPTLIGQACEDVHP